MWDCDRIIDLERNDAMKLVLINYGFGGEYERVPGGVQFKHRVDESADHLRVTVRDFSGADQDTGLAVYIRVGAPVAHETTRVEGLGLHHAIPIEFDAVFELDEEQGEFLIDEDSVPGFEPGVEVYGSIASINRGRIPLDVVYVSAVVSADALVKTGQLDLDLGVSGGCSVGKMRPSFQFLPYGSIFLLSVLFSRRRQHHED